MMEVKILVDSTNTIKDLKKFSKDLKENIEDKLDKVLNKEVDRLKILLKKIINREITFNNEIDNPVERVPPELNYSKSKTTLIKEIFGADITTSDALKPQLKGRNLQDGSKVFTIKDGRLKVWQSVGDSSTYEGQENLFKNRLKEGILIDSDTGKIYKINPENIAGVKVECSTDTGMTIKSLKKFDAYKNSSKITRRKDGLPDQRMAIWTIKKEDLNHMLKFAIPIDRIIENIQDGKTEEVIRFFNDRNINDNYSKIIENLNNIEKQKNINPDTKIYQNLNSLITNLKIRKRIGKAKTTYTLVSNYNNDLEENNFFSLLKQEIYLWKISNEEKWIKHILKTIKKTVKEYNIVF